MFIVCFVAITLLKIVLSAIEPASSDLLDIVKLAATNSPVGPWIALYPPLYGVTSSNFTALQQWALQPPGPQIVSLSFRLPVLAFDIATAIALYYVARKENSPTRGRLALLLWFINPFSLISIELLGVPDVAATFFVVLTFFFFVSNRPLSGAVALAIGTFFKFFPILLLPPLLLYAHARGASTSRVVVALSIELIGLAGYLSWLRT